jgi:hypothetical protein
MPDYVASEASLSTRTIIPATTVSMGNARIISPTIPNSSNVRLGIAFGYQQTGNLAIPAAGDVKTGITYGANGTEFTGTFAGVSITPKTSGIAQKSG